MKNHIHKKLIFLDDNDNANWDKIKKDMKKKYNINVNNYAIARFSIDNQDKFEEWYLNL